MGNPDLPACKTERGLARRCSSQISPTTPWAAGAETVFPRAGVLSFFSSSSRQETANGLCWYCLYLENKEHKRVYRGPRLHLMYSLLPQHGLTSGTGALVRGFKAYPKIRGEKVRCSWVRSCPKIASGRLPWPESCRVPPSQGRPTPHGIGYGIMRRRNRQ